MKINYCNAIIECCKRAEESNQHKDLIRFIEESNLIYSDAYCNITDENMLEWNAEEWIRNIADNNSSIPIEVIEELNHCFYGDNGDSFIEYCNHIIDIPMFSHSGYYELCGVYWYHDRYHENIDEDFGYQYECESDGPTINLEELRNKFGKGQFIEQGWDLKKKSK